MPIFLTAFAVVIVLVAVGAYFAQKAAKKRRMALQAMADEYGWRFDPGEDPYHDDQFAHFEIFRNGHSRTAFNSLTGQVRLGERDCDIKLGDFRYKETSGSGEDRRTTTYLFSYLVIELPFAGSPELLIRPEGFFDKLAGAFGFDDIDFESAEFSRKFYVKSSDKRFAYDVIHPRMMDYLLETRPLMINVQRDQCCFSDGRRRWEPDEFKRAIQFVHGFLELWPEHVTRDLQDRHA